MCHIQQRHEKTGFFAQMSENRDADQLRDALASRNASRNIMCSTQPKGINPYLNRTKVHNHIGPHPRNPDPIRALRTQTAMASDPVREQNMDLSTKGASPLCPFPTDRVRCQHRQSPGRTDRARVAQTESDMAMHRENMS